MADAEPEPMQAGVVNVLLTIDPAASHAAGTYVTWDGVPFDEEETARCDAATPHELWAWAVTTDEAPGADAGPRADVRRLTTIVAGAAGQAPEAFNEAMLAFFAGCRARDVLGPGGQPGSGEPGSGEPAAGEPAGGTGPTRETAPETGAAAGYRPYPAVFRETVLPRVFRETVLPGLAGLARDEALEILGRLEREASAPAAGATG